MPDYATFSASDFTFDPAFRGWVSNPTPQTNQFWQNWLLQHPNKRNDVQLARQVVLGLADELPRVEQAQIDQDVARMLARIQEQDVPAVTFQVSRGRTYLWWAAAAAIVLTVGVGWLANRNATSATELPVLVAEASQTGEPVFTNRTDYQALVTLPDGTTVTLSPNSTLRHGTAFGQKTRDVTLTGEAFFKVVRNENVPFRVYSDDIVTKVLGTSFRVSAYAKDRRMTVTVRTGKVSVYARMVNEKLAGTGDTQPDQPVISLTPNQAVEYSRTTKLFRKTLTNNPVPIDDAPAAEAFVFDETPISEVFQRLEKTYGIPIDYDKKRLRDCALTASLANENLTEKLTAICKGIEGRYEIIDGRVVIQSAGCR